KGGPNQRGSSGDMMLPSAVQLLPTPTAMDSRASGGSGASDVTLTDAMVRGKLLPTPTATPYGNNQSASSGASVRPSLDGLAPKLLPTPSTADGGGGHVSRSGARSDELLLPGIAAAISRGDLTDQPSTDGNEPSDE